MARVIHTSLRESRTLDEKESVSSLWIWNSGLDHDKIMTSEDEGNLWMNQRLGSLHERSERTHESSIISNSQRTTTSHLKTPSSSGGQKPRLSLSQKMQAPLSAPSTMLMSPSTRKGGLSSRDAAETSARRERLSFHMRDIDNPTARKETLSFNVVREIDSSGNSSGSGTNSTPSTPSVSKGSQRSYNSDDYGSIGEMSLERNKNNNNNKGRSSWWNLGGTPLLEEDPTERESDYMPSPATSMSKYVKRIGTSPNSSIASAPLLHSSDREEEEEGESSEELRRPKVVEIDDEDDDLDSVVHSEADDDEIDDTAHQRSVHDDIEDTAHQRSVHDDLEDTGHQRVDLDELQEIFDAEDQAQEEQERSMREARGASDPIAPPPPPPMILLHEEEEEEESVHKSPQVKRPTQAELVFKSEAEIATPKSGVSTRKKPKPDTEGSSGSDRSGLWFETALDTEQKYKQRKTILLDQHQPQTRREEEEEEDDSQEDPNAPPKPKRQSWWELGAGSSGLTYDLKMKSGRSEEDVISDDEVSLDSSSHHHHDQAAAAQVPSHADIDDIDDHVSMHSSEDSSTLPEIAPQHHHSSSDTKSAVSGESEEEIMKWLKKKETKNRRGSLTSETSDRLSSLLPSKKADEGNNNNNPKPSSSRLVDFVPEVSARSSDQSEPSDPSREYGNSLDDEIVPMSSLPEDEGPVPELIRQQSGWNTSKESADDDEGGNSGTDDDHAEEDAAETVHSELGEAENDDTLHTNTAFHESVNDDTLHTNAMSSTLAVESTNDDTLHTNTPTLAYESIDDGHGYKCDVMVPKKRASQVQQEQQQRQLQDEKNTSTEAGFQGFTNADPNLEELEDMTIDDDCSESAPSFEVENIVVVSSNHSRSDPTKINSHDSCVSSMHFSTWFDYGDDEDEADTIGRSMRSFASTLMKSSEFGKEEDAVIQGSLNSSALNSSALTSSAGASSQDSIQVMENPDGRSGTWTISGTYENASKEEMLKMLKKIQDDILGAGDSSSNLATSSSNLANSSSNLANSSSNLSGKNMNSSSSLSAYSLVFKPGVQRTVSGITMSSMKSGIKPAPVPVRPKKPAARKSKRASARNSVIASTTQSGWKKVAVNPGDSVRTKRTGKKKQIDDNAPLTNLSDVKEESLHDISERSNFERSSRSTRSNTNEPSSTRSTRTQVPFSPPSRSEGRKPVEERGTEKRKPRKGRRKPDEADNFYMFEPIHSDSNSISRESNSSDKTNKVKNKSSPKTGRSKSLSNSPKPKKGSSKHRRSTSLEAAPSKKSSSKKEKSGKETPAYESSPTPLPKRASSLRAKSSKAESLSPKKPSSFGSAHKRASSLNIRTPFKFGRSSSVPSGMEDTTKQKPEKEVKDVSKRNSTGRMVDKDSKASASSTEEEERMERSERRERLRQKKESSLRRLNRKLDKAIGIQASPGPSPGPSAEKKKKARDLHKKVKEQEGLREKFRVSFVKVMSSKNVGERGD